VLLVTVPGAPPQVHTVVNRFKLWRTGTVLQACFLNGDQDLRKFFVSTARVWLDQGGLGIDFGAAPTYRNCFGPADPTVRIAFGYQQSGGGWDTGNWSYVGTDARTAPAGPTINIGYAANTSLNQLDQHELKRLVLHELGHFLALEHEHQSPLAQCEFDWTKVVPYYQKQYGWDETKVRFNLGKLSPIPGLQATEFDPHSIMNYTFPPWMFKPIPGKPPCEIKGNYDPSQTDLSTYAKLYPGKPPAQAPVAAASAPLQQLQAAQEQQDRVLAERAARAVTALEKLFPDRSQQQQIAELISSIAQRQFLNFKIDLQSNNVTVGNAIVSTAAPCNSVIIGAGGDVKNTVNCIINGFTAEQMTAMVHAVSEGATAPLTHQIKDLQGRLGVTEGAALAMLRSVGQADVRPEHLPLALAELAQQHRELQDRLRAARVTWARWRVLWVDDTPRNNEFERQAFEEHGIEFALATSTSEARRILTKSKFDAIISDMGRPPDSEAGYTLLGVVRSSGARVPYFIYSSSGDPRHVTEALSRGAQGSTNRAADLIKMVLTSLAELPDHRGHAEDPGGPTR